MHMRNKAVHIILVFSTILSCTLALSTNTYATVYFYYDAESGSVGNYLPYSQTSGPSFDQEVVSTANPRGTVRNSPLTAKQGTKYFGWTIMANETNAYMEVRNKGVMPFNITLGKTYYLAYFFNYTETNGAEVYRTNIGSQQCFDKGEEMVGNGLRWCFMKGSWTPEQNLPSHTWTIWTSNPNYHLNPVEYYDMYLPNASGYSLSKWVKLQPGQWHSAVLAVKMAQDNTGSVAVYINGIQTHNYANIKTVATGVTPTIDRIVMHGTFCQPAYNTNAHVKNYDAMILTDNWQDIINGGYLSASTLPPAPADGSAPAAPTGLTIKPGQ